MPTAFDPCPICSSPNIGYGCTSLLCKRLRRAEARVAELEAALVDLRGAAETSFVHTDDLSLMTAIGRANRVIGPRSVDSASNECDECHADLPKEAHNMSCSKTKEARTFSVPRPSEARAETCGTCGRYTCPGAPKWKGLCDAAAMGYRPNEAWPNTKHDNDGQWRCTLSKGHAGVDAWERTDYALLSSRQSGMSLAAAVAAVDVRKTPRSLYSMALAWNDKHGKSRTPDMTESLASVLAEAYNMGAAKAQRSETARPFRAGDVIAYLPKMRFRIDEVLIDERPRSVTRGKQLAEMTMIANDRGETVDYKQMGGPCHLEGAVVVPSPTGSEGER